ncbi:Feline leukemia virus subgroup C receptor protein 1 [Fasciola gigantica]|uniref:Feline leukemia virus subgroup C receptor protein 1 n=1 Tax=Fasciola gigantica TaxID=46835 RepID=A0A504YY50_FASGI|nr:Feline leukemia virus subgroup C receptor protein 1 [Fasciola gigantica]
MLEDTQEQFTAKLYRRRWVMLLLFCWCSASNSYHWIHLNIISDRVLYLWNTSIPGGSEDIRQMALDWLSMVYLLAYIPLIVPATWLLDRYGLKVSTLLTVILNALGAWIKCLAGELVVDPQAGDVNSVRARSAFPILMFAQTLDAIAQVFILGAPAELAATWFGDQEISTATSIGVLANQLGVAIGFCIPAMIVPALPTGSSAVNLNGSDPLNYPWIAILFRAHTHWDNHHSVFESLKYCMMILLYGGAAITTLPLIPVIFAFKAEPPSEPTYAQYVRHKNRKLSKKHAVRRKESDCDSLDRSFGTDQSEASNRTVRSSHVSSVSGEMNQSEDGRSIGLQSGGYKRSLIRVLKNRQFMLLFFSYGINTGVYYALGTLLNYILLDFFPGDAPIGWIGFTMVISGIAGSIIAGIALDRTKKHKLINSLIYLITLISMAVFTGVLQVKSIALMFVISFVLGFAMTGILPLGFEFAAELTYPESEGLTSGLLNASAQLFGIILTLSTSKLKSVYGSLAGNLLMTILLLVGFILIVTIKEDLRRQKMIKTTSDEIDEDSNE